MEPTETPDRAYLEQLEQFLDSDQAPPDCMLLSELDGYLTGLAAGPEAIPQDEWMIEIWNGEEPNFASEEQTAVVTAAILRRYNEIRSVLQEGKWTISPIFWQTEEGTPIADDWAEGFMAAVRLRFEAWEPLFLSPEDGDMLIPILALCGDEDGEPFLPEEDRSDELLKTIPELIPQSIDDIYVYWRDKALIPKPIRKIETAGRNDACPCGSGKKFKRCCGA